MKGNHTAKRRMNDDKGTHPKLYYRLGVDAGAFDPDASRSMKRKNFVKLRSLVAVRFTGKTRIGSPPSYNKVVCYNDKAGDQTVESLDNIYLMIEENGDSYIR